MSAIYWIIIAIAVLLVLYFLMKQFGGKKKGPEVPPQTPEVK